MRGPDYLERLGQRVHVAVCLANRSLSLQNVGRHREALDGFDEARTAFESDGQELHVGACLREPKLLSTSPLPRRGRHRQLR